METPPTTAARRTNAQYAEATDGELVVAALLSDLRAFDELTRRYRAAVIATAAPFVRDRAAAEDLAQEVFLMAFYALPQLDDPAKFGGWLRVVTRRQAQRFGAREKVKHGGDLPLMEEFLDAPHTTEESEPEAAYARREETETIWAAMEMISPDQREILLLFAYEDWPLARIAEYLGVAEGAARVRLFRAREALRRVWAILNDATIDPPTKKTNPTRKTKPKGKRDNGRTTEGGSAPSAAAPQADVQGGGTGQHDRGALRGRGGTDRAVQYCPAAPHRAGGRNERAVPALAGGRLA